jgi:hypothetical protein
MFVIIAAMKTFPLLMVAAVALLTGCATADFTPYVGEQQRWPTAKGAFVTTINSYDGPGRSGTGQQYTLPVYFGPPNRPYVVLGSVDVDTPVGRLFEGSEQATTLNPAVRVAGQHGADAIIVIAQDRGDTRIQHDGFRARAVHHQLRSADSCDTTRPFQTVVSSTQCQRLA